MTLERETLHITDNQNRIALVETRTQGNDDSPAQLVRYQHSNHLRSATLELDEVGQVITYEEFCPYGSTSYQAMNASIKASAKRYRFTGKERDDETGLANHGARYYACWLGRWTTPDPAELVDGTNRYVYTRNNPISFIDPDGKFSLLWAAVACVAPPDTSQSDPTKVAVAGWDDVWGSRKSFRESAEKNEGFTFIPESWRTDRIPYEWDTSVMSTGREFIEGLRQTGSVDSPITEINISSHGTPYAIDFGTPGNNLYISRDDVRTVTGDPNWSLVQVWPTSKI